MSRLIRFQGDLTNRDPSRELRFEPIGDGTWRRILYESGSATPKVTIITSAEMSVEAHEELLETTEQYAEEVKKRLGTARAEREEEKSANGEGNRKDRPVDLQEDV